MADRYELAVRVEVDQDKLDTLMTSVPAKKVDTWTGWDLVEAQRLGVAAIEPEWTQPRRLP